jgi:hypothetical protein
VSVPPELLGPLGLTACSLIAVVFLAREHRRSDRLMEADRDYWRDLALRGTELADKATSAALRTVRDA